MEDFRDAKSADFSMRSVMFLCHGNSDYVFLTWS